MSFVRIPRFRSLRITPGFYLGIVTGLGPDYIISGPWPELTVLAPWFRQEAPSLLNCK